MDTMTAMTTVSPVLGISALGGAPRSGIPGTPLPAGTRAVAPLSRFGQRTVERAWEKQQRPVFRILGAVAVDHNSTGVSAVRCRRW